MKEISVDGCSVIGTGTFGKVYRLNDEIVVKVYDNPANLPLIREEQERSKRAFVRGIPTAIPFGIAKVGQTYGSVFELLEARNCNDFIAAHPDKEDRIIGEYAALVKRIHTIKSEPGEFPDTRNIYLGYLDCIKDFIPSGIYARLAAYVKAVPESQYLTHGDVQMKNIMLSHGEMFLIDMNTMSAGDSAFEFAGLYRTYIAFNLFDPDDTKKFLGLDKALADKIYFRTAEICGVEPERRDILILAWLRFLHVVIEEHSSPKDPRVASALKTLGRLLDEEDIH